MIKMNQTPNPITSILPTNERFCTFIKPDGERCGGYRQRDSEFCWMHDPRNHERVTDARKRGGKRSQSEGITDWTDRELKTVQDVENLIQDLLNATIRGDIHPRLINATNGLLTLLLKAKELGSFEDRLAKLESEIIIRGRA